MSISLTDIINDGFKFANTMALKSGVRGLEALKSKKILQTDLGTDFVANVVIGSIMSYHQELRKILLEQGIDIGDIDA